MHRTSRLRGFTLIELLTVIAIIAILTAILFPIAGTVREQARASDCMSKLHQLWVSANVYKADEGSFPPVLFGYVEGQRMDGSRVPWNPNDGLLNPAVNGDGHVAANNMINGFLYRELVKDVNQFRCDDSSNKNLLFVVQAHFPTSNSLPAVQSVDPSKPYYWPLDGQGQFHWYGDFLAQQGCPTDQYGVVDCFWEIPASDKVLGNLHLQPRYFYAVDSYDVGPALDANGEWIVDPGTQIPIYYRHYSTDWTGVNEPGAVPSPGQFDIPEQLRYANPPDDKTILTYCTWHQAIAHTGSTPAISMGGTAKKLNLNQVLSKTALVFAR
jgi:prepilin-type N-terminal cleavage/methylation domain-containing protein